MIMFKSPTLDNQNFPGLRYNFPLCPVQSTTTLPFVRKWLHAHVFCCKRLKMAVCEHHASLHPPNCFESKLRESMRTTFSDANRHCSTFCAHLRHFLSSVFSSPCTWFNAWVTKGSSNGLLANWRVRLPVMHCMHWTLNDRYLYMGLGYAMPFYSRYVFWQALENTAETRASPECVFLLC